MTNQPCTIERASALTDADIQDLAEVLIDCVDDNASVSFMHPLHHDRAIAFWTRIAAETHTGQRALLLARDHKGICATVQLQLAQPENQPHRADLSKMLVHRRARRTGLGKTLLQAAEATARALNKTLLVLDTQTGSIAEQLYKNAGWQKAGEIPNYALTPKGNPAPTSIYYRLLAS